MSDSSFDQKKHIFSNLSELTILHTVSLPGFHPAGHTSPCLSVYWKACTNLNVSSTDLPTGRSFIVICRNIPLGSMMNKPLKISHKMVQNNTIVNKMNDQVKHGLKNVYNTCECVSNICNVTFEM